MEEKNKPGETVPEPGESERISAERKAALQDIDRKREEKEKLRQTQKQEAVKVHGSLSAYMNWPLLVCISLLILSIIITMIDWMAGVAASACFQSIITAELTVTWLALAQVMPRFKSSCCRKWNFHMVWQMRLAV